MAEKSDKFDKLYRCITIMYTLLQCNYMYSIVQKLDRAKKGQMKYAQNFGKQNFDECENHVFTNAK